MKPRITISLRPDGELEIFVNPEGRDLLVEALQSLNEGNEHFHIGPEGSYFEVEVSSRPYRPDDKIVGYAKVNFRTDEWDRQHCPHVFGSGSQDSN